jgi:hypothetical protein
MYQQIFHLYYFEKDFAIFVSSFAYITLTVKFMEYMKSYLLWNKNVDIYISVHDVFLKLLSSGTLKVERLEAK